MSNARSPREVCSITIGINGLMSLLASGGPDFLFGSGRSFVRGPQLVARLLEVERDPLHLGDDEVESLAHPQVVPQELVASVLEDLLDDLLDVLLALPLRVLADELANLVVGHLDAGLVGDGLEDELAGDRHRGLSDETLLELLCSAVRGGEVGVERDLTRLEGLCEAADQ